MSEINGVENVKKYYATQMMSQTLKKSLGDGMEFEIVYQALLDSMENGSLDNVFKASEGQFLPDMPIEYKDGINSMGYVNFNSFNMGNLNGVTTESSSEVEQKIYESANKYGKKYNVDPKLIVALIKEESAMQPQVVSSAGAQGLMQLMPSVCKQMGVSNPFDIDQNIEGGVKLLRYHLDNYDNNTDMALMAYASGAGEVEKRGVTSIKDLYKMPQEAQNFIPKLMKFYNEEE